MIERSKGNEGVHFSMVKRILPCFPVVPALMLLTVFTADLVFTIPSHPPLQKTTRFERLEGFELVGHVIETLTTNELGCGLRCLRNEKCLSYNSHANGACQLSSHRRYSKPDRLRRSAGSTYYGKVSSLGSSSSRPAHSCKHIRDSGDSKGDGEYWIDPERNGNSLPVYCDMATDGGGWLLVSNVVIDSSTPPTFSVNSSFRAIDKCHTKKMFLEKSAMADLRSHLFFTQLRFYCSKQQGRTFHVTTVANSNGEAVVQYFSGQTDVQPAACGSFVRMENDNSLSTGLCHEWGHDGGYKVGKWGHGCNEDRLFNHPAFVVSRYHWVIEPTGARFDCDDKGVGGHIGNAWKVFVR